MAIEAAGVALAADVADNTTTTAIRYYGVIKAVIDHQAKSITLNRWIPRRNDQPDYTEYCLEWAKRDLGHLMSYMLIEPRKPG